jgi:dihydrolipoamide dehydrogenase
MNDATIEVKVPDIGDFENVDVIEVHCKAGDRINPEDSLITLESDKATMDVPAPSAGVVQQMHVKVGDKVSKGDAILTLTTQKAAEAQERGERTPEQPGRESPTAEKQMAKSPKQEVAIAAKGDLHAQVLVLGSGPGGYTAAFRAADLGQQVVLVERYATLGGVCLNVGCIPSKALLHAARVIAETKEMAAHGIEFGEPEVDLAKLRGWKDKVVGRLTGGLAQLAKQRKVRVVEGRGKFASANALTVESADGPVTVTFDQAIVAAGSQATMIPGLPEGDARVMDSTDALEISDIPKRLLVIGGGIIGLEMATVYYELGSRVTVVELMNVLMPGVDPDIVKPLQRRIEKQYEAIYLGTQVKRVESGGDGLRVSFDGAKAPDSDEFDKILVAVGRRPNGKAIDAQAAGVRVDERGFIPVDKQQRTNVPHIFAIGDIVGPPMLAHKATHEGKVAAEVAAGMKSAFDARVVPAVAYTDPEVAWTGVTETDAKQQGVNYGKGTFPWAASGRALGLGRDEGMTKLLFDRDSGRVIGAGIVGPNAGDLIAEVGLAIEMGCDAQDIGLTIHPHPTLSETVAFAAEAFEGTITDLYMPRKK